MKISIKKNYTHMIGIALFITLSMCLRLPVYENHYLCLGYLIMAIWLYSIGITDGIIVGCFGTILYCILITELQEIPGRILKTITIGILLGLWFQMTKHFDHTNLKFQITTILITVFSVAYGVLIIKSATECLLYHQSFLFNITTNLPTFMIDSFTFILSVPICQNLHKIYQHITT